MGINGEMKQKTTWVSFVKIDLSRYKASPGQKERSRTIYPITKAQVRRSLEATLQAPMLLKCSVASVVETFCLASRATAICRSRSDRLRVVAGKSGRMNIDTIAKPIVITPSIMKSHRQPRIPWAPSRPLTIPAAIKPPNAPERTAAEINTPNLLDCSVCLYHDERRSNTPGAKPASIHPMIILRTTKWVKLLTAAMTHVSAPHRIIIEGRKIEGRDRPRTRLWEKTFSCRNSNLSSWWSGNHTC